MKSERQKIQKIFSYLLKQPEQRFPQLRQPLKASHKLGVYVIRKGKVVLHVGCTPRGKNGLHQRLVNHLKEES